LETKANAGDLPTDADIFGPTYYLEPKTEYVAGSHYTIDTVINPPICDQPGYVLN